MINVVHIIDTLGSGGAEKQLLNLIKGQQEKTKHTIIVLRPPLFFIEELRNLRINIILIKIPSKINLRAIMQTYSIIKNINPDIIHTWLTWPDITGRIISFLTKIKVICSIQAPLHSTIIKQDNPNYSVIKSKIYQYLDIITAYMSKSIQVGCTKYVTDIVCDKTYIPLDRRYTIYNTSDILEQNPINHNLSILSVGRLVPQKGFIYLIQAMVKVIRLYPNSHLYIAGDGPLRSKLTSIIIELGLQNHVTLLGIVKDMDQLYKSCNLFVLCSIWEGFGVVVIEATSRGLPCIVSNIPPFKEILDENNIFFNPTDINQIAESIHTMFNDRDLQQFISNNNYNSFLQNFSTNITSKHWFDLYQQITNVDYE